jgi:uncharacterized protein (TIGR02145 family)
MKRRIIPVIFITVSLVLLDTRCKKDDPTTVTDKDGNVYHMITIGKQVWSAENLKTTKFDDGNAIPLVADGTEWWNHTSPGYCWYNNGVEDIKTNGPLYNWYAVNTNKLCPAGWHVPSDDEWKILTDYLGGESIAGGKLKETGTDHWIDPKLGATNESRFTALPGGDRFGATGVFENVGIYGTWWSSTQTSPNDTWSRFMVNSGHNVTEVRSNDRDGLSVRCLKD